MKQLRFTLLTVLAIAAAFTVGCGDSKKAAILPPANPTFSKLPFISDRIVDPATNLFLMNLDGSSVTPVAGATEDDDLYSPSISADFTKVVFTLDESIFTSSADGSSQNQLTDDGDSYYAKISPDGTKIAFGRYNGDTEKWDFWVMNFDGTGALDLTVTAPENMQDCVSGSFSADSSQIVFSCYNNSNDETGLYLINVDGTGFATVTTQLGFIDTPVFSPDSSKVLFISYLDTPGTPGTSHKTVRHAHHRGQHHLVTPGSSNQQGLVSINPDGTGATVVVPGISEAEVLNSTLYYTFYDSDLDLSQIYKANLDGSGAVSLSDGTSDDWLGLDD